MLLIIATIGVTYTFFNYTRTGSINNLGTGRIYFYSDQDGSLNITNVFPQKSSEVNLNNLDSVSVTIEGNPEYTACGFLNDFSSLSAATGSDGNVNVSVGDDDGCFVYYDGYFGYVGSDSVEPGPGGGGTSP